MERSFMFITKSLYTGEFSLRNNLMDGFGNYFYANGSSYRGYFLQGKFHGVGRVNLHIPHGFILDGLYDRGSLVELTDLKCSDGLNVNCKLTKNGCTVKDWQYCTLNDRRFYKELKYGLPAVGPEAYESCERPGPGRTLKFAHFDTVEGIYNMINKYINHIKKPFKPSRFVIDKNEVNWITKYCRTGPRPYYSRKPEEPPEEFVWNIIDTNVAEAKKFSKQSSVEDVDFKHHYANLCPNLKKRQKNLLEKSSSSASCQSFDIEPMTRQISDFFTNEMSNRDKY